MNLRARHILWGCAALMIFQLGAASAPGQPANRGLLANKAAEPPLPEPAKSPVDFFRELLLMSLAERNNALAARPAENRKQILAKVREYEALKPDVRELRLRATELRWHLLPLMRMSATNRIAPLAVPAELRPLVETRLKDWDKLSPDQQKDLLDREAAIQAFTSLQTGTNLPPIGPNINANRQRSLDQGVTELRNMPEDKRQDLLAQWKKMFELNEDEKERILKTLSGPERAQIEKTLRKFDDLSPAQRASCVRSFEKFSNLRPAERQQFLKNAAKWSLMTNEQRKQWQDLVDRAPLLPPSFVSPPLPPRLPQIHPRTKPQIATNAGSARLDDYARVNQPTRSQIVLR